MKEEDILVIPTKAFHDAGYFQGFSLLKEEFIRGLLTEENVSFRRRADMEGNPSYKQLIPYMIIRYTEPDGTQKLFRYVRGKGMGEGRLHEKHSVGVGGHISTEDVQSQGGSANSKGWEAYHLGMLRELSEEVEMSTPYKATCVGLINDDLTEVGKVHLGVVHILDVETPDVAAKETDLLRSGFVPVEELMKDLDLFESWSSISLKALFDK